MLYPRTRLLVGTALAVCLFTHSAMAAKTVSKDVCVSSFGMNWQTSADAQAFLLTTAKRQAVGELFGEVIRSITQVRNFQLTRDDIEAVSAGFIRVQGSPEYYKGQGLGEVCVRLSAYVTDADVARFAPRPVQKKVCIGDPRLSLGEIRKTAERQARIQAVRDVEPGLETIRDEMVLGLMHEGRTESGGFLPDTTVYCSTVSGTVYPIELMAVTQASPKFEVKRENWHSIGYSFIPTRELWWYIGSSDTKQGAIERALQRCRHNGSKCVAKHAYKQGQCIAVIYDKPKYSNFWYAIRNNEREAVNWVRNKCPNCNVVKTVCNCGAGIREGNCWNEY